MSVGLPEEGNITDIYKFGTERMLMIKERAAYEIKMADTIDPDRSNEQIPNIQQRILQVGSDNMLVQTILLTCGRLFDQTYLADFDCDLLKEHALNATREILSMDRTFQRMRAEEVTLVRQLDGQELANGFILPHLSDAEQDIKNFLQRADHFTREMFGITRKFEKDFGNVDTLLSRARREAPPNEEFVKFLERACPFVKFVREARNAVEHPIAQKHIEIYNFELDPSARIILPSIEVVHPKCGEPRTGLISFLKAMIESLTTLFGAWVAHLCARKASFGKFGVTVMRLPEDKRTDKRIAYSYALNMGGEWHPVG